jgi:hypothetical protein
MPLFNLLIFKDIFYDTQKNRNFKFLLRTIAAVGNVAKPQINPELRASAKNNCTILLDLWPICGVA